MNTIPCLRNRIPLVDVFILISDSCFLTLTVRICSELWRTMLKQTKDHPRTLSGWFMAFLHSLSNICCIYIAHYNCTFRQYAFICLKFWGQWWLTICNAACSFERCLKVLMLSTAVSDDLCYGLWVCIFVFVRLFKTWWQGYKNRVFFVCLDGTKWSSVYICCFIFNFNLWIWWISDTFLYYSFINFLECLVLERSGQSWVFFFLHSNMRIILEGEKSNIWILVYFYYFSFSFVKAWLRDWNSVWYCMYRSTLVNQMFTVWLCKRFYRNVVKF